MDPHQTFMKVLQQNLYNRSCVCWHKIRLRKFAPKHSWPLSCYHLQLPLTASCSLHYSADVTYPKSAGELLVVVVVLRAQQLKEPEHAVSFWELSHLLELWLNSFTEILRLYWRQHRFWHKLLQSHLQIVQQQYVIFVLNRKLQLKLCKQQKMLE